MSIERTRPGVPTTFAEALERAIEALDELNALSSKNRLSAAEFVAQACREADIDANRLEGCVREVETGHPDLISACNRMQKEYSRNAGSAWPAPARPHMQRAIANMLSIPDLATHLLAAHLTLMELLGVAAFRLAQRQPGMFGTIECPYEEHLSACETVEAELGELLETMKETVTRQYLTKTAGRDGFVRYNLKLAEDLNIEMSDWPRKLVERLLARRNAPAPKKVKAEVLAQNPVNHAHAERRENAASRM